MTSSVRLFVSRLLGVALVGCAVASCSTVSKGSGGEITKVKYYFLDPQQTLRTYDPTIRFEREHYLHGAYTAAEQIARTGHYYTVMWKADDRSQPVTVRFEYRQAGTALQVKTLEQQITDVRKRNETFFQVVGKDYQITGADPLASTGVGEQQSGGRVTAWRVSILRGKEELASQDSYLWK